MEAYKKYKDSGIDWLGKVPEHWEIERLKNLFREKKKTLNPYLPTGSISFGKVVYKDDEKIPETTKATYQEVLKGDYLINPLNLNYDLISLRIALSEIEVVVSSGYIVIQNIINLNKIYYKWLLHQYDISYMKMLGSGVRQTINFYHISNSVLLRPPLSEQEAIASFLEEKCGKIDEAISIKESQIVKLREFRQITIHEAVTKGLDKNVKMKDSGIDWIGEIPEHWQVKAMKRITHLQSGDTITSEEFKEDGYPVFGGNGFRGYTNRYTNEGKTILIGRQGALCGNVNIADGKFFASEHAIVVYPLNNEDIDWLGEIIRDADLNRLSQSAAQPGIAVSVIKNSMFPYPPISEQIEIGKFIKQETSNIDQAIEIKEKQIAQLKEYKQSLINEVVTGKVCVPQLT